MKKIIVSVIICVLMIILNILINDYISAVLSLICLFIVISQKKKIRFKDTIIKLQQSNQIYLCKEDKLNAVLGDSSEKFVERCQILKSEAKDPIEASFYQELSLCSNKTQIDRLVNLYLIKINRNHDKFLFQIFLLLLLEFVLKNTFNQFINFNVLKFVNLLSLLYFLFISVFEGKQSPYTSYEKRLFIKLFHRFQYATPMISLKEIIDEEEIENSIYNHLFDNVREGKIESYHVKNQEVFSCLYKVLFNNKFNNESVLINYYKDIVYGNKTFYKLIEDYYFIIPTVYICLTIILL